MDINEFSLCDPISGKEVSRKDQALFSLLERLGKSTITVVNRFSLVERMEILLACTMRVALPNAKFGLPEVRLGITLGLWRDPAAFKAGGQREGHRDRPLSAETINAQKAYRIGILPDL